MTRRPSPRAIYTIAQAKKEQYIQLVKQSTSTVQLLKPKAKSAMSRILCGLLFPMLPNNFAPIQNFSTAQKVLQRSWKRSPARNCPRILELSWVSTGPWSPETNRNGVELPTQRTTPPISCQIFFQPCASEARISLKGPGCEGAEYICGN